MSYFSKILGLSLGILVVGGCEASRQSGPVSLTPGTAEYQMRQDQLRSLRGDSGRANQNPVATGMSSEGGGTTSIGGVQRMPGTGGAAGASAGTPTAINPSVSGIERSSGVGAPVR